MRLHLLAGGIAIIVATHHAAGQSTSPAARGGGHALAYDSRRGMSMLYGDRGSDATTLWGWDGNSWHAFNQPGPGLRRHIKLAYAQRVHLDDGAETQPTRICADSSIYTRKRSLG